MEDMQAKMNSILSDPDMMQKIMAMAQSLGQTQEEESPSPIVPAEQTPQIDLAMIQRISSIIGQSNIGKEQRILLNALQPYINQQRVLKLEKAMRAAKLASMASAFLSKNGLSFNLSR